MNNEYVSKVEKTNVRKINWHPDALAYWPLDTGFVFSASRNHRCV